MIEQTTPATPADAAGPAVSVVIPVYNAMPYLRTQLDSLVAQDLPADQYEVLAIDDGSSDDSGAVLDEYAAGHEQIRVVHQPNSGWPGIPRNRGLDLARGRYVFFADADDEMGPEALRRMVTFADEHGSDVLVPKMIGVGGRWVRASMYAVTQVDADLENVFTTLTPQKMFRRSFLLGHGIRFPEEKVRLEDGIMLAEAYYRAGRVSLLGGYDFYHLVARDDGQNISSQGFDPDGYTWSIGEVSRIITELDPDPERARRIVLGLYRRKCLKFYQPARFWKMRDSRRGAFLAAHRRHIETYITPEMEQQLPPVERARSALVRAGDKDGLLAASAAELGHLLVSADISSVRWVRRGLEVGLELRGGWVTGAGRPVLEVGERHGERTLRVDLERPRKRPTPAGEIIRWTATARIGWKELTRSDATVVDLSVLLPSEIEERVRVQIAPDAGLPTERNGVRPYATSRDNLSLELGLAA